jgi:Ni,Fe-hydrogenase I large subunit
MTASFAVENAAGYSSDGSTFAKGTNPISEKALLLRNLVLAGEFLHSHIIHFYTLAALDYVMGPPMSPWIPYFGNAPTSLTDWEQALTQLSYPGDYQNYFSYYSPYLKPGCVGAYDVYGINSILGAPTSYSSVVDELNDQKTVWARVIAEYVEALHWKRKCFELASLFSGPQPMWRNLVMGGLALDLSDAEITARIDQYEKVLYKGAAGTGTVDNPQPDTLAYFVYNKYYPLVQILAVLYPDYTNTSDGGQGIGQGLKNFLGYGVFNDVNALPGDAEAQMFNIGTGNSSATVTIASSYKRLHKRGYYIDDLGDFTLSQSQIVEYIDSSWYVYSSGTYKHPFDGETDPEPTKAGAYTWSKAPRIMHNNNPVAMEVGPLARMWVSGLYRDGVTLGNDWKHAGLGNVSASDIYEIVTDVENGPPGGNGTRKDTYDCGASVIDRHRARALEEVMLVKMAAKFCTDLRNSMTANPNQPSYTPRPLPKSAQGYGLNEAPRGALAHFIKTDAFARLDNHQAVVPSTWNDSPTAAGSRGAIEEAIMNPGLTLANSPSRLAGGTSQGSDRLVPLEVLRVIRSFDPCLACTVHTIEKKDG